MSRRRELRIREQRREHRVRELEARVARLESTVEWLRRAVHESGEHADHLAVGPCPKCEFGVLARKGDRLYCRRCGYGRYL